MKNTIGIITLLLMSYPIFADEHQAIQAETKAAETSLIESDADATETSTSSAPKAAAMNEQSGFSRGSVVRSAFTTEITEREPTQNLQNLTNENGKVMFFTELRDMSGQTAIHRWEYEGKVVAEVKFDVKGPRWRVWSSKSLIPQWTGDWKVSVVNGAGDVISEKNLSYDIATATTPAPSDTAIEKAPAIEPTPAAEPMQ